MALFEQYPEFDDMDDLFVEQEEEWTEQIARYIDEHIERFATVKDWRLTIKDEQGRGINQEKESCQHT